MMNVLKTILIVIAILVALDLLLFVIMTISIGHGFSLEGFLGTNAGIRDFFLDKFR